MTPRSPRLATLLGLAIAALMLTAAPTLADGVVGTWLTENDDAKIEITTCGEQLCGHLVWMQEPNEPDGSPKVDDENPEVSLRDRPLLGLQLLSNFPVEPQKRDVWEDGNIYDPESGRTYSARLTLKGDELRLRGYLGISLLGRTSVWTRTEPVEAPSP
ncbi:MAG: DUF2147 domain-containing protein [Acidobacteriota bacterium]